jgi:hypothetical protein
VSAGTSQSVSHLAQMSPHDGQYTRIWSNISQPNAPAFLHNLISNIAQDFLHKDSKLLLTSLTPSKLLLDNNGNKLSVNNLDQDCLFKLLNREDVIAAVAGKLGSTPRASANGLEKQVNQPKAFPCVSPWNTSYKRANVNRGQCQHGNFGKDKSLQFTRNWENIQQILVLPMPS